MSNQTTEAPLAGTPQMVQRAALWDSSLNTRIGQFFSVAHRAITVLGIAALFVLGLMFFNPDLADKLISMSPFSDSADDVQTADAVAAPPLAELMSPATPVPTIPVIAGAATAASASGQAMSAEDRQLLGTPHQQKLVTSWLAKRYREKEKEKKN